MHNLSLSGCGFLGIYHIGVISAFREHAPEYLMDKISGCSAGSLVAACAICDCCLGQMVSDTLEIALKARSHALGPLHPSFNIVEILKNGLRRILPVDAHKICTDRLHVSITRWKDGKNFLVNKFESREDLIQALICSSFVPAYSGMVPPKFRGVVRNPFVIYNLKIDYLFTDFILFSIIGMVAYLITIRFWTRTRFLYRHSVVNLTFVLETNRLPSMLLTFKERTFNFARRISIVYPKLYFHLNQKF